MSNSIHLNKIHIQDVFTFLESLPNDYIDLAIVDPPYNLKIADWDNFKSKKEFLDFSFEWIDLMLPKLKNSGSFYIFNTPYNCALFLNHLKNKKVYFQNFITWYKKDGLSYCKRRYNNNQESILFYTMDAKKYYFDYESIRIPYNSVERIAHASKKGILKNGKRWYPNQNGKLCPDVWEITSERHKNKINGKVIKQNHPTPKPKEMIERMIKASSKSGDLVLDLFSGTGTTSIIANQLGRKYIGCEINKNYIDSSLSILDIKTKRSKNE
ncbi:DNA-methyltransferase [Brachyspira catarrhinii]|uniref:Methyltransferase n=1 Tax=Brachyspira catarrhinii TaxID=2528966 RepID=A0ABY2TQZ7_9SPIR|nr:site-specific DNA-methyltransferase [Brachyspira catarrhinii]TKZ35199.1 site-specific DNA-methyltransferase [Brachyspira catarrhinii]